jgi:hypothetical protein
MGILHCQSHDTAGACANAKGRDKDARGDFDAEGHDGEGSLYDQCDSDHAHDLECLFAGVNHAETGVSIQ